MRLKVLNVQIEEGERPKFTASHRTILWGRLLQALGSLLNRMGLPAIIRPISIKDQLTGMNLKVEVTPLFTKMSIDGRDFYFKRFSGRFDGTGQDQN